MLRPSAQGYRKEGKTMEDFNAIIREFVKQEVKEQFGELNTIAEAMVRMHGEFIKPAQAAKLLNVEVQTVYRMCKDGRLAATQEGSPLIMVRSLVNLVREGDINNLQKPRKPRQYSYHRIEA